MNKLIAFAALATLWGTAIAQEGADPGKKATGSEAAQTAADGTVTITSKGKDVREVLTDIFVQAKKNFVIDKVARQELFLNLANIELDETLEIICRLANLKFEVQNGIYYFTKIEPTKSPTSNDGMRGDGGTSGAGGSLPNPNRLQGRLADSVLTKKFTTRMTKVDFRDVIKAIGRQTDVWLEVAPDVEGKKVDAFMIDLTLKQGLDMLTDALGLAYRFTDNQSILVYKPNPNRITVVDK